MFFFKITVFYYNINTNYLINHVYNIYYINADDVIQFNKTVYFRILLP